MNTCSHGTNPEAIDLSSKLPQNRMFLCEEEEEEEEVRKGKGEVVIEKCKQTFYNSARMHYVLWKRNVYDAY